MSLEIKHWREAPPNRVGWEHRRAPAQASSADLLWYFFPGDVEVAYGGAALASRGASVPALHFVAGIIGARDTLAAGDDARYTYSFTEADQWIDFWADKKVHIECNFSDSVLTIPLEEFSREVCDFARREIDDLVLEYPALLMHPLVRDLLRKCDDGKVI
ncbi:hypothetical protein [Kribbella voronezhensis]|uniref:hypothetical protein n=1 Tax=Kribbella voronezhensis TaxID=2512212 RepID=UPI0010634605|nr:hypothetical protein [Kribbella voronezhensis]